MKKHVNGREKINCFLIIAILFVIFSNFFAHDLEIFLRLKPNIPSDKCETSIHFIDVGQGDAIAIKFGNGETMLIDSGTSDYRQKLTYYLDNIVLCGKKVIDYVVLTHPDADHSGNMQYIIENYDVKHFYRPCLFEESENIEPSCYNLVYRELLQSLQSRNIDIQFNCDIDINKDDLSVKSFSALSFVVDINKLESNDFSPIIVLRENGKSLMLAGDMSSDMEEIYLKYFDNDEFDIDILKLSHHGSKYSTSEEFLEITSPRYVVACVGINTYGHPANDTLLRLINYDKIHGSRLYSEFKNTRDDGNIIYYLNDEIDVYIISNIDDYNFVDYYIYSIIFVIIIAYSMILPYYKIWKKNIRFVIRNKKHSKLKEKEQQKETS